MRSLLSLLDELFRHHEPAELVGPNGERTELPASAFQHSNSSYRAWHEFKP